ncbi:MAG: hypothetical protein ACF8AM_24405, partial [Rhodopirellula sp. JB055]|uniref:hypothetical protein n=1 Tax=Rhodopirellula sp. JB055 TaxID=3342846 RepID=UPI00370BB3D1
LEPSLAEEGLELGSDFGDDDHWWGLQREGCKHKQLVMGWPRLSLQYHSGEAHAKSATSKLTHRGVKNSFS